ncbi:hypothetical protein HON71_02830 [Candidatus Woesearchaeota archaeon]|jgi:hypothetical protein|nr:hypothetical protein [Candidatus Woesearchaeota archaeon]MBT5342193.1 hypothetical protein [Candidatus Woesearchaeota archaeon]
MVSEKFIAELEKLGLEHVKIIKEFLNNLQEYFPDKDVVIDSPNALMKYLTKALSQLAGYIDHNKSAAKEDANLKFKWEKAMVSYNQLQKALKELRGKHDYGGLWNRIRGKGGMFK